MSANDIRILSSNLASLKPKNATEVALLGLMAGVLYALERAFTLGYTDGRVRPRYSQEKVEVPVTLGLIGRGNAPTDMWLAGFYFDSAIMRLAALE